VLKEGGEPKKKKQASLCSDNVGGGGGIANRKLKKSKCEECHRSLGVK
jgi:hypothetical protein